MTFGKQHRKLLFAAVSTAALGAWCGPWPTLSWLAASFLGLPAMRARGRYWRLACAAVWIAHWFAWGWLAGEGGVALAILTLQACRILFQLSREEGIKLRFADYWLACAFFPQALAGPISAPSAILPQLARLRGPEDRDLVAAVGSLALGFFKITVLANRLEPSIRLALADPAAYTPSTLIQAWAAISIQAWASWSGLSDLGGGLARLAGIRLQRNFLSPWLARSPSDFLRRWNATLTESLEALLPIPRPLLRWAAIFPVMAAFYGLSWRFALWSAFIAVLLGIEELLAIASREIQKLRRLNETALHAASGILTFFPIFASLLLFRIADLKQAGLFLRSFSSASGQESIARLQSELPWHLACALAIQFLTDPAFTAWLQRAFRKWLARGGKGRELASAVLIGALLCGFVLLALVLRPIPIPRI